MSSIPLFPNHSALTRVHRQYLDQHKVAVVCSARSGSTKALGTTNLLLKAASEALSPKKAPGSPKETDTPGGIFGRFQPSQPTSPIDGPSPRSKSSPKSDSAGTPLSLSSYSAEASFNRTVDVLRHEHLIAAKASVRDPEILKELEDEIDRDCDSLRSFLFAAQVSALHCLISAWPYDDALRSSTKSLQDRRTV